MELSEDQVTRYARHILLPEVGGRGQARLCASGVRVLGRGRAAEECARYLAAAGVGRLALDEGLDRGIVEGAGADVSLVPADPGWPAVGPFDPPESRLLGALAAVSAVLGLTGTAPPRWTWQTWLGGPPRPVEEGSWTLC